MSDRVTIYSDQCKSCRLCVPACPVEIIGVDAETINVLGFNPVMVTEPEKCTGCATCAIVCPDIAIRVER